MGGSAVPVSILSAVGVLAFTFWLTYRYARRGTPTLAIASVVISWFLTFSSASYLLAVDVLPEHSGECCYVVLVSSLARQAQSLFHSI